MQYLEYLDTLTATSSFPHSPLTTDKVFHRTYSPLTKSATSIKLTNLVLGPFVILSDTFYTRGITATFLKIHTFYQHYLPPKEGLQLAIDVAFL